MTYAVIGDVHGCINTLGLLLDEIRYFAPDATPVFCGDLIDRGPSSAGVLDTVMHLHKRGRALAVLGNHDDKLRRYLNGAKVNIGGELATTIFQVEARGEQFVNDIRDWLNSLPYQLLLDDGNLSVSHAGLPAHMQGVDNKKTRARAMYGKTTGRYVDGYPERVDWAVDYRGTATVVHGHVRGDEVVQKNDVWCIDTSCVYGNKLTALLYPSMKILDVDFAG